MKVLLAGVLATVGSWGAAEDATAAPGVPFRARFVVAQDVTPDPACGGLHVQATGHGSATALGDDAAAAFDECVNLVQQPGRVHVHGTAVLTSASGDQLHLRVDKQGSVPDAMGNIHVAGPYWVTGGTGRFTGATGSGTTTTDTNIASDAAVVEMIGTLQLAAGRPLQGTVVVTESRTPDPACRGLRITGIGTGQVTPLGPATAQLTECVNLAAEPGRVQVDGTLVLRAPAGQVHLSYALEGDPPDPVTGQVHVSGPFVVAGGTGRFSHATGGGTLVADTSVTSDTVTITVDGTVSRLRSSRRGS